MKRDVYFESVQEFNFDLDLVRRNSKGEILKAKPKTSEELAELEFSNQVYERVFRKMEKELNDEEEEALSDDDCRDIRDRWLD